MLDNVSYCNHLGEQIKFGAESGIYIGYNDLRDFEWEYETKKNKIVNLQRKPVVTKKVPLVILCKTEAEGTAKKNLICEIMDKDTVTGQRGRFLIGDYYLECCLIKSEKTNYLLNKRSMSVTIEVASDRPAWKKETIYQFAKRSVLSIPETDTDLDYPIGYSYDYFNNIATQKLNNESYASADFELTIYGYCDNPAISIGENTYTVTAALETGEYLKINSVTKKIYKVKADGEEENLFFARGRDDYIFEKIPVGNSIVAWPGGFGFDLNIISERSEPVWT